MVTNLYRADAYDADAFIGRLAQAEHAITYAQLPMKTQFSFGAFRCRARVLGNRQRFAIALSVFIGRIPFSAENRALRHALLDMDGTKISGGAAKFEIKSDNWVIASVRFPVIAEPTRVNLSIALTSRLMQVQPALDAMRMATITD
ncbi:MAG: hypothetical protein AAF607_05995 [Pseudomonadota bacterium]